VVIELKSRSTLIICIFTIVFLNFLAFNYISPKKINSIDLKVTPSNYNLFILGEPLKRISIGCVITHGEQNPNVDYTQTINDAKNMGATVSNINSVINAALLKSYDILVVEDGGSSWSGSELTALKDWVNDGGGLYLLGDNHAPALVSISSKFNVYFNTSAPPAVPASTDMNHPIFNDVNSFMFVSPSASINLQTSRSDLWKVIWKRSAGLIVSLEEGSGRIVWNVIGEGMVGDGYIHNSENKKIGRNTWIWLANLINPASLFLASLFLVYGDSGSSMGLLNIIIIIIVLISIFVAGFLVYRYKVGKPRHTIKKQILIPKRTIETTTYKKPLKVQDWRCPFCHAPISRVQAEKLLKNRLVKCEYCGGLFES